MGPARVNELLTSGIYPADIVRPPRPTGITQRRPLTGCSRPTDVTEFGPMHWVPVAALSDNYIWLVADDEGNAFVVDPGEAAPVQAALDERGWRLKAVLLTHPHNHPN